jgi:hypothetical protein
LGGESGTVTGSSGGFTGNNGRFKGGGSGNRGGGKGGGQGGGGFLKNAAAHFSAEVEGIRQVSSWLLHLRTYATLNLQCLLLEINFFILFLLLAFVSHRTSAAAIITITAVTAVVPAPKQSP